jgi:hypothetical protein
LWGKEIGNAAGYGEYGVEEDAGDAEKLGVAVEARQL